MDHVHEHNRRAWDERVAARQAYIDTATEKDFQKPLAVADPFGWLDGNVAGKRVLCLAAGGGRHSVLFAAAGARVTVVDLSPQMLALDRQVAAERGLTVQVAEASMNDLSALGEASFDIVVQPVSTCYVPDIAAVYRQVARVVTPGGIYVSHHKQPVNMQADFGASAKARGYRLIGPYYRTGPLPPVPEGCWHREAGTLEFLHRWEALLGDLCRSGFVIEDVAEPLHADPQAEPGSFGHRSCFVPPYIGIKARRTNQPVNLKPATKLWTP